MILKPLSVDKLKEIWVKVFLSRTDKVTKVSDASVLSGTAYGNSKTAQKALKDIALAQSHFYPDTAYGQYLDNISQMSGIASRFGALGSSTYLRIFALPGTVYTNGVHTFSSSSGIIFNLVTSLTIGNDGFGYAHVSSVQTGEVTNLEAGEVTAVSPIPAGHTACLNEYAILNGRDSEGDDQFRDRIKSAVNVLARPTLSYILQVMLKYNSNVLRVFNYGVDNTGKIILGVATQDGSLLSGGDISSLITHITPWLSLAELNPDGILGTAGVTIVNVTYQPVDISFRCQLDPNYDPELVRKNCQVRMNKYLDYRNWVSGSTAQWTDLLQIAKTTEGLQFVPDVYFFPNQDILTNYAQLPRIRGFLMLDLDGNLISNGSGSLNPTFYPAPADFSFIATVLANLT